MPNLKISALPSAATITGTETIPLVQAGATKAATVQQLLALIVAGAPGNLDTFFETATQMGLDEATVATLQALVAGKADTAAVAATYLPLPAGTKATGKAPVVQADGTVQWATVSFKLPAPTGVAATDQAAINAAVTAATAAGGGTILFQTGTYRLTTGLPVVSGLHYVGIEPAVAGVGTLPDGDWNYVSGTILKGDGTFDCLAANTTALGATPTIPSTVSIQNFSMVGFGLDGFVNGINIGATNSPGIIYGSLDKLWIKNCSGWGVRLSNFFHLDIGRIYTCLCQHGQYYGNLNSTQALYGNSIFGELYNVLVNDGRDNRLCRGIVFESSGTSNGHFNELNIRRLQNNGFGRTLLSVTATLTSGTTAIAVPDGTKFAVGMLVNFTTTNYGFTTPYMYFVQAVAGNTITLGLSRTGAAITPSGSGTLTLQTYGMPNVEFSSLNTGTGMGNSVVHQIDSEGVASAGVYVENAIGFTCFLSEMPGTTLANLVVRGTTYTTFHSASAASNDFDGTSNNCFWVGQKGTVIQRQTGGIWRDSVNQIGVLALSGSFNTGDLHTRTAGLIYPVGSVIGDRYRVNNSTETLSASAGGVTVVDGAATVTKTLPTIVTDTTLNTSNLGLWFEVINAGSGTVTLATDGTQTVNNVTSKTTLTVAAGTGVRVTAVKNGSSILYWVARAVTLAT